MLGTQPVIHSLTNPTSRAHLKWENAGMIVLSEITYMIIIVIVIIIVFIIIIGLQIYLTAVPVSPRRYSFSDHLWFRIITDKVHLAGKRSIYTVCVMQEC
jgi:hypothetical protein